jgi:hypothetical protein
VIAMMIVSVNLSRIAVMSSCLICRADDEIVGTKVKVEGCDGECKVEAKDFEGKVVEGNVEDKIIEGVKLAKTNFAAS